MQKTIRINESQLLYLSSKARVENTLSGALWKRSNDTGKWQQRWFALYQNLLFYYENETCPRPSGVALLEGCYCERIVSPVKSRDADKQFCFAVYYQKEGQRQYELRAETESECAIWIEAIQQASFSKVHEQKEQVEQKHLHLLQILDTERQAKWHYVQQTEELVEEVRKLKHEIRLLRRDRLHGVDGLIDSADSDEIRKIKKVQSFFRGWLCRRRWKQIVELYIRSDHAESMRKRNSIVFSLVECEEEYVKQLSALVSVFLRPLRMAASSKNPSITHDDVNSIFLNSETLLFLHQIFLKGLLARMENWPTIVLDLFDMLLPMLGIYQEYVRNHHYSLQVLAEYKQKLEFNRLLKRYEEKPVCEGRSLATFLTYPMHQVPRYIITIHQLLAHTPHDHVERKSLEFALSKLEEISQIMQDEVSETENIRKNLSIERMIVEGCDILLDVNQTFVRQGTLVQVSNDKSRTALGRLGSFSSSFKDGRKETVRMAFLFTNHLLLTSRASNGRLHLAKHFGKIPLSECTLIEDTTSDFSFIDDDTSSYDSSLSLVSQLSVGPLTSSSQGPQGLMTSSGNSLSVTVPGGSQSGSGGGSSTGSTGTSTSTSTGGDQYNGLDFRILMDARCGGSGGGAGPPVTITLVASSLQEKAAWCSDISQCIENLHCTDLLNGPLSETSSVAMPQSVRTDPKLFRDDIDIKFSRSLNSCKVPQIRHASVDRLLDRLTDLRFLSIDFLNTFLLTYRVFTTGRTVMEALRRVYRNPEYGLMDTASLAAGISTCSQPTSRLLWFNCMTDKIDVREAANERPLLDSSLSPVIMSNDANSGAAGSLLSLPKTKLAPIASCETLSESFDVQPLSGGIGGISGGTTSSPGSSLGSSPVGSLSDDSNSGGSWGQVPTSGGSGSVPLAASASMKSSSSNTIITITTTTSTDSAFSSLNRRSVGSSSATLRTLPNDGDRSGGGVTWTGSGNGSSLTADSVGRDEVDSVACGDAVFTGIGGGLLAPPPCAECGGGGGGSGGGGGAVSNVISSTSCETLLLTGGTGSSNSASANHLLSSAASSDTLVPGSPLGSSSLSGSGSPIAASTNSVASMCTTDGYIHHNHHYHNQHLHHQQPLAVAPIVHPPVIQQQQQQASSLKRSLAALLLGTGGGRKSRGSSSGGGSASGVGSSSSSAAASLQSSHQLNALALSPATSPKFGQGSSSSSRRHHISAGHGHSPVGATGNLSPWELSPDGAVSSVVPTTRRATSPSPLRNSPVTSPTKLCRAPSPISYSYSSPNIVTNVVKPRPYKPGSTESELNTNFSPRSSCCTAITILESGSSAAKAGAVVTSSRASRRRSSSTAAANAFAVATAGSSGVPKGRCYHGAGLDGRLHTGFNKKRESAISTAATMRVLNILRHWVSKHSQDFDTDPELKNGVKDLLEDMISNTCLLPAEHKAALSILYVLTRDDEVELKSKVNLELLLAPPEAPSKDNFDTLSALDIAEQMTYLDHQIFMAINSDELLGQAWMKPDKAIRAPHVLLVSKRFNEASCLVVSEIVRRTNLQDRAACIEKWAAIADICRCMHNYNGVLQICAAFVNSAIYRLRKTWEKIPKQSKQMVERLQVLVSSDGRFKNMRDALHRCDPPCIPYLGMYLTDLSFIEEGTPNTTDEGLINFSKMRMVTHVIKEIQLFQQTPYKIEHHRRVTNYLLDPSRLLDEEQTFRYSLEIEPRTNRISSVSGQST